jgi:hypothetical protein
MGSRRAAQSWIYLFSAWDTGHYVDIAANWYRYPKYVFFPAYPVLCRLIGMITDDFWLSAFLVSFTFGLASIPIFQLVCEHYMSRRDAFMSTLLAMTFPYVFLFTTVSYTESLFLFSTLLAWHFYLRRRLVASATAATVATLTKTYGIAIVIPIAISLIDERKPRKILSIALPGAALFGWMCYLYLRTGDAVAFLTQQAYWDAQIGTGYESPRKYLTSLLDLFLGASKSIPRLNFTGIAFEVALFGYLIFNVFGTAAPLGVYSIVLYLGLLCFGNLYSYPRYLAFIFPVWLTAQRKIRSLVLLAVAVFFFLINGLAIWAQFIMGGWVS